MQMPNVIVNRIMQDPRFKNNQIMQNAFQMYQQGNLQGVEQIARNVCQTQGKNIDELMNQAKGFMRMM